MPSFLENLGLDSFMESEDAIRGLLGYIANKGEVFQGYTKDITIYMPSGSIDFFVRVKYDRQEDQYLIEGLDTHICGMNMWKIRIQEDLTPDDADPLSKRLLITNHEYGNGLAVVNVLNSHMLPSLMKNDVYDFQVSAFPVEIDYYQDEEAYCESVPKTFTGQTYALAKGTIFPAGFFLNHDPRNVGKEVDYSSDELVLIMGEVKGIYWGTFELEGEEYHDFVISEINTQFGMLRIAHTVDQVSEDQRAFIKPGCIVSGIFALSADAAVGEYEKDAVLVLDEEKCLKVLKYAMCRGDMERLQAVLGENVIYDDKISNTVYQGAHDVLKRNKEEYASSDRIYEADMAHVASYEDGLTDPCVELEKRCFLIKEGDSNIYEAIVFISTDDTGKIIRITKFVSREYYFLIDQYPHPEEEWEEPVFPTDYQEAILQRAKLFGWIDRDFEVENISYSADFDTVLEKAEKKIGNYSLREIDRTHDYLRNLFGYFFALGFQKKLYDHSDGDLSGVEDDKPEFSCCDEDKVLFERIYEYGKLYFIDFKLRDEFKAGSTHVVRNVLAALRFLCHFGYSCATEKLIHTLRENLDSGV